MPGFSRSVVYTSGKYLSNVGCKYQLYRYLKRFRGYTRVEVQRENGETIETIDVTQEFSNLYT